MFLLLCLTSGLIIISAVADQIPRYDVERAEQLFEDFILTHGKTYSNQEEKQMRLNIFKGNLNMINKKNSMGGAIFGINHFSDLTKGELVQRLGLRPPVPSEDDCKIVTDKDITTKDAPKSVDWVEKGAVSSVKEMGVDTRTICFSCYAFSTAGNIEGQYFIKNRKLLSFSVQQILDCSKRNYGCRGGNISPAMTDLMEIGGLVSDTTYPYEGVTQTCRFNNSKAVVKLVGCAKYQLTDEDKLKEIVAKRGPISVHMSLSIDFMAYTTGILPEKQCSSKGMINHAALIVGYGTENGTDYWLIKNSWGVKWGDKGYARITRGENTCGLMNSYAASADL